MRIRRLYESNDIDSFRQYANDNQYGRITINSSGECATLTRIIKPRDIGYNAMLKYKYSDSAIEATWYVGCSNYFGMELENGTKYEWQDIDYSTHFDNLLKCYEEINELIEKDFELRSEDEIEFDNMVDDLFPTI